MPDPIFNAKQRTFLHMLWQFIMRCIATYEGSSITGYFQGQTPSLVQHYNMPEIELSLDHEVRGNNAAKQYNMFTLRGRIGGGNPWPKPAAAEINDIRTSTPR
jgi:hypothetical protein